MSNTTLKEACKQAWGTPTSVCRDSTGGGYELSKVGFEWRPWRSTAPDWLRFPWVKGSNATPVHFQTPIIPNPTPGNGPGVSHSYADTVKNTENPKQTQERERKEGEKLVQIAKDVNQVRKDAINVNNLKNTPRNMLAFTADAANRALMGIEDFGTLGSYALAMALEGAGIDNTTFLRYAADRDRRVLAEQAERTERVNKLYGKNINPEVAAPWANALAAYATGRLSSVGGATRNAINVPKSTIFPILGPATKATTRFALGNIPEVSSAALPFARAGANAYVKYNKNRYIPDKGTSEPWYAGNVYNVLDTLMSNSLISSDMSDEDWYAVVRANWPEGVPMVPIKRSWYDNYTNQKYNNEISQISRDNAGNIDSDDGGFEEE